MMNQYKHQTFLPIDWPPQFGKDFLGKLALLPPLQLQTHNRDAICKIMAQKLYTRGKIVVIPQVTQEKQIDIEDVLKLDVDVILSLDVIKVNTPLTVYLLFV